MISKKQKAFTLAEILMIAGIVALMGSIILIFSKGAIEKARIAKGLNFSAQIHHALGSEAVGLWDFETGYGTNQAIDNSGNSNHGTIYGAQWIKDTPTQTGYGLRFDGIDDYVEVNHNSSLDFDDKITISLWVKINSLSGNQTFVHGRIEGSWEPSYWLGLIDGNKIGFKLKGTLPATSDLEAEVSLSPNIWYHLVGTYNGSNAKIYLDGREIKSQSRTGNIIEEYGLRIGKTGGAPYPLYGIIDEVRIYKEGLSSTQIKKLYVEGVKTQL